MSDYFKFEMFPNLSGNFLIKIKHFIDEVENGNFDNLKGRNKPSDDVDVDDGNFIQQVKFAQQYQLWHYHLGIPQYEKSKKGDLVSDWLLHYRKLTDKIIIVDLNKHPFKFPREKTFEAITTED